MHKSWETVDLITLQLYCHSKCLFNYWTVTSFSHALTSLPLSLSPLPPASLSLSLCSSVCVKFAKSSDWTWFSYSSSNVCQWLAVRQGLREDRSQKLWPRSPAERGHAVGTAALGPSLHFCIDFCLSFSFPLHYSPCFVFFPTPAFWSPVWMHIAPSSRLRKAFDAKLSLPKEERRLYSCAWISKRKPF